jgi:hypothetical protein
MDFLTREVFDTLILVVVMLGLAFAFLRLRKDFTRPLPPERRFPLSKPFRDDELDNE